MGDGLAVGCDSEYHDSFMHVRYINTGPIREQSHNYEYLDDVF